jgi:hypothetical protein
MELPWRDGFSQQDGGGPYHHSSTKESLNTDFSVRWRDTEEVWSNHPYHLTLTPQDSLHVGNFT